MKNIFKYIILPSLLLIIFIVSFVKFNIEAFNYELSWGGNKGKWIYSDSGYIYPNHSINFKAGDSLRYNGVTVTSGTGGGGIAASDNITFSGKNTFQYKTIFSDTLKADGLSLIDNARITSDLNVTGDVISDLNFLKGSSTSIGTISTDSLAFITNNTKRIIIDKNGYTNFTDTVSFSDVVIPNSGIVFPTVSSFLFWNSYSSKISEGINSLNYSAKTHNFLTKNGNNNTAVLDSANGLNLAYGVFTGNGSGLTSVDAITLKGQDTTNYAHTTTGTTESFLSKVIFSALVTFQTTSPVFNIAAVFNVLQDFANGLTTTTLTASGTATFNGDLVPTGWTKNQSSSSELSYTKEKLFKFKAGTIASPTTNIAHGLDWHNVYEFGAIIKDDTLNFAQQSGQYFSNGYYVRLESLNVVVTLQSTSYGLANDSGYAWVRYLDPNR
jgi:hypothetical protein